MAAWAAKEISPGSSGQLRLRSVTTATTGKTSSKRYLSTLSGVWSWSQVPHMEPVRAKAMEGANSFQRT